MMNGSKYWKGIMNMNSKIISDIGNWAISSGFLAGLVAFLWSYLRPLLKAKEKAAKTAQQKELLALVDTLADTAVTSLVGNRHITGSDKFKAATQFVSGTLADQGHEVSEETVSHAVQAAYEKSPLTGNDAVVNETPAIQSGVVINGEEQPVDPVLEAVKEAPNRVNVEGDDAQ